MPFRLFRTGPGIETNENAAVTKGVRAMKRWTDVVLMAALFVFCGGVYPARAVTFGGKVSTQAMWFSDEFGADHFDLAQYVRASARHFDKGDTVQVSGYGRATGDAQQGGGVDGRLYYLYLDKRGAAKATDVRVGRQFFFVSAGSGIVDGARIDTRIAGPIAFTLVGGRNVLFHTTGEATKRGDAAFAAQASLMNLPDAHLDLSCYLTYDENDLAKELVGMSGSKRVGKYGELYTRLRYDVLSEVFGEIQLGGRSAFFPKVVLNAEYFRSIPVFEATSIFSVFAVDRYQEVLLRADYELTPKVTLSGEYRNESYGGGDKANAGEAGVRYRPADGMSVYGAGIWRVGTGGNLAGFELSGDLVVRKDFLLSAGLQRDSFRRELMTGHDDATRIWAGVDARIRKNVSASARIEDTISDQYSRDVRGRLALNVSF
ncbi:MAG: hypothetical protein C4529_06095 [Deltaproteobacteria bacterium]|nr:MAG: hypothetical protein C4529_06095 [Deltaproteobacteria bacterium]